MGKAGSYAGGFLASGRCHDPLVDVLQLGTAVLAEFADFPDHLLFRRLLCFDQSATGFASHVSFPPQGLPTLGQNTFISYL